MLATAAPVRKVRQAQQFPYRLPSGAPSSAPSYAITKNGCFCTLVTEVPPSPARQRSLDPPPQRVKTAISGAVQKLSQTTGSTAWQAAVVPQGASMQITRFLMGLRDRQSDPRHRAADGPNYDRPDSVPDAGPCSPRWRIAPLGGRTDLRYHAALYPLAADLRHQECPSPPPRCGGGERFSDQLVRCSQAAAGCDVAPA